MFIVVVGSVATKFEFIGPFKTRAEVDAFSHCIDCNLGYVHYEVVLIRDSNDWIEEQLDKL